MYRFIAKHILAPGLDVLRGTQAMSILSELEKSQWWGRQKIIELQEQRLKNLLQYSYEKVPYYRRVFDERRLTPGDIVHNGQLVKLPVLTRQIIRSHFDEIAARNFPQRERVKLATGGSTGEPLLFYSTWRDHKDICIASRQRASSAIGFELGDKNASIRNVYPAESRADRFWRAPIRFFDRSLPISVADMGEESLRRLEAFQPAVITGYPSPIEQLARIIQARGATSLRPRVIVTGAEQLFDHQRELFRQVFGCDTYDFYGAVEEHLIAFECKEHAGYHIAAENVFVEIVDAEGMPLPPGEEGRILITNLHNYAMPLIRYDIGDLGTSSDIDCPCGRGLPLLSSIGGRILDTVSTRHKGRIPGLSLYRVFRSLAYEGVEQCQIVQESPGRVVIKLVAGPGGQRRNIEELTEMIVREYQDILGEDMEIAVEFVDRIATTAGGKRRFIISDLKSGTGTELS